MDKLDWKFPATVLTTERPFCSLHLKRGECIVALQRGMPPEIADKGPGEVLADFSNHHGDNWPVILLVVERARLPQIHALDTETLARFIDRAVNALGGGHG